MTTQQDGALARVTESTALVYPVQSAVAATLASIEAFQTLVKASLHDPRDFTMLPGTSRHTLLKPGAEKIVKLISCADTYEVLEDITDWDRPLFAYTVKCRLVSMRDQSVVWSEGLGECNTHEPKYRYRTAQRKCPHCGHEPVLRSKQAPEWYCWTNRGGCGATWPLEDPAIVNQSIGRIENKDPAELRNTMLKMAKKRSLVDAALSVASLSDLFTQDMDDRAGADQADEDQAEPAPARAPRRGNAQRAPARQPASAPRGNGDGDGAAYGPDGEVETLSPQAASNDVGGITNGGTLMEYINARWPGHTSLEVCGCLNVKKIGDLEFKGKKAVEYVKALEAYWGTGTFDGDGVVQEPETEAAQEEGADASPADEAAVLQ